MSTSGRMRALTIAAGVAVACGPGKDRTVGTPEPSSGALGGGGAALHGGASSGGAGAGGTPGTAGAQSSGGSVSSDGGSSGGAASPGGGSGGSANGGKTASSGGSANGGKSASSGGSNAAGATAGTSSAGSSGQMSTSVCDNPSLVWRSANKTNYTSYPDPGSEECVKFNGCTWAGQFAGCDGVKSEAWVMAHNIVAAFPDFNSLKLHDLCLRKGTKTIVVTVFDTCGDSDCDGCCTQNKGSADQLIDVESYTDARWGVPDGKIEWADLGAAAGDPCR